MKLRKKRIIIVITVLIFLACAGFLIKTALNEGAQFFYSPSEVKEGKAPQHKTIRIGGLVESGSLKRAQDGITASFSITDTAERINVRYKGILPDLFKEGKGAIVIGTLDGQEMSATEVLAKHDENYMPPQAQQAVDAAHQNKVSKPQY